MPQCASSVQPVPKVLETAVNDAPMRIVPGAKSSVACSTCCLNAVCLPSGLEEGDLDRFDEIATVKRRIARGATLYRSGDFFDALYALRSGAFKTLGISGHGDEKITGFHLPGEVLGLGAIHGGRHRFNAVALEDSEICVIPFAQLEQMAQSIPALQHRLLRVLSSDITRDQGLMLLLGGMTAEQRLAAFLLQLSRRHRRLGFAANRFMLRMTREEIGNYLGLSLETVSRMLSRFHREELITVRQREIELTDAVGLANLVGHW
jgi:CRP/FNR family transcriptional regulator, anaerobic regulatory protein